MKTLPGVYSLFSDFIDKYLPDGFQNIDPDSPLMLNLDRMMEANNQFFFIGNLIHMKVIFTSRKSSEMIGIASENVDSVSFINSVHPDELTRLLLSRTKLLQLGGDLFVAQKGIKVISTTLRFRQSSGNYANQLIQCYLFYEDVPFSTVFILQVNTDISWFNMNRHGYHYYVGDDPAFFRYPDDKLLMLGNVFSDREFEIIKLISEGSDSGQIADKLFLSVHTINTHRRNIIKRANKSSMIELILDLKNRGLL